MIPTPSDSAQGVANGIPLELEQTEIGMYRGRPRITSSPMSSIFGGEVVAQALRAAGDTVPADRAVHSLHAYFLRRGDPHGAVLYRVEDIRDGTSFTTRRVVAQQHGEAIFSMAASFHRAQTGVSHQVPVADAPPAQSIPPTQQLPAAADSGYQAWLQRFSARFPIELRFVDPPPRVTARNAGPARFRFWMRTREALPPTPLIHACATAYASDLLLLSTAAARHGMVIDQPGLHLASLDHAVWFHGDIRADDWLLYEQHTDWAGGGRTLCRGALFDPGGTLVATVVQEGLLRMRRP